MSVKYKHTSHGSIEAKTKRLLVDESRAASPHPRNTGIATHPRRVQITENSLCPLAIMYKHYSTEFITTG